MCNSINCPSPLCCVNNLTCSSNSTLCSYVLCGKDLCELACCKKKDMICLSKSQCFLENHLTIIYCILVFTLVVFFFAAYRLHKQESFIKPKSKKKKIIISLEDLKKQTIEVPKITEPMEEFKENCNLSLNLKKSLNLGDDLLNSDIMNFEFDGKKDLTKYVIKTKRAKGSGGMNVNLRALSQTAENFKKMIGLNLNDKKKFKGKKKIKMSNTELTEAVFFHKKYSSLNQGI